MHNNEDKVACIDALIWSPNKFIIWARGPWDTVLLRSGNIQEVLILETFSLVTELLPKVINVMVLTIILKFELMYKHGIWEISVWFAFSWRFVKTGGIHRHGLYHKKEALVTFFQENLRQRDTPPPICASALALAETYWWKSIFLGPKQTSLDHTG